MGYLDKICHPFNTTYKRLDRLEFDLRKQQLDQNLLFRNNEGVTSEKYVDHEVIVSLTTYGRRLQSVYLAIESIMEQTMKANRIVLWLDEGCKDILLPQSLKILKQKGLEIFFCKDIRSYKKLIPSLAAFPEDAIITIDDDVIYDINALENLIQAYKQDGSMIYCNRCHRIVSTGETAVARYNKWNLRITDTAISPLNFPTGVGAILYPPHSLDEEVMNESVFMDICKNADDVWFKAMALKNGTMARKVKTHNATGDVYVSDPYVDDMALMNINVKGKALNDKQFDNVFRKYNLYPLLRHVD